MMPIPPSHCVSCRFPICRVRVADSRRREPFGQFASTARVRFQQVRAQPAFLEQSCSVVSDVAPTDDQDVQRGLVPATQFGTKGMD